MQAVDKLIASGQFDAANKLLRILEREPRMDAKAPINLAIELGDKLVISPPLWPNTQINVQPGDLKHFSPQGNGVYGYQIPDLSSPFKSASRDEEHGGLVYFGNGINRDDLDALLRIFGVNGKQKDYAVFLEASEQPGEDGYIHQMRLVSKFGLKCMFDAITDKEYDTFKNQDSTLSEAIWTFIEKSNSTFGTSFGASKLSGLFGGDGHFACEELSYGMMLENSYYGIVRIWSRAWLVTK